MNQVNLTLVAQKANSIVASKNIMSMGYKVENDEVSIYCAPARKKLAHWKSIDYLKTFFNCRPSRRDVYSTLSHSHISIIIDVCKMFPQVQFVLKKLEY